MEKVCVKKDELIEIIRKNMSAHEAKMEQAVEGYWKKVTEASNELVEKVKSRKKVRPISIHIPKPESHVDDYETAIKMLKMHQGETLCVDETTFRNFVLDQWSWSARWKMSNSGYWGNESSDDDDDESLNG